MSNIIVQTQQLTKVYQDGENQVTVLSGVDLTIERGETLAIIGSSGSGKSTLLHILGTLDNPTEGRLSWLGSDIGQLSSTELAAFRNRHLGFIYQFHHLLMDFTAVENVAMPLLIRGESKAIASAQAAEILELVGLGHRTGHKPAALSGGERQRVAIARALVAKPDLVLADEPTGNLDHDNALKVYELMRELNQKTGVSFVIVTHDPALAQKLDKQYLMQQGKLVAL